jgi:hypothetical protein
MPESEQRTLVVLAVVTVLLV